MDKYATIAVCLLLTLSAFTQIVSLAHGTVLSTAKFDFGTTTSTVETGWTGVDETDRFTPDNGYGWTNITSLASFSRAASLGVNKDAVTGIVNVNGTFVVVVAAGTYHYTISMIDANYTHNGITVKVEGVEVASNISVTAYSASNTIYYLIGDLETNGEIQFEFSQQLGAGSTWMVNSLTIEATSPVDVSVDSTSIGALVVAMFLVLLNVLLIIKPVPLLGFSVAMITFGSVLLILGYSMPYAGLFAMMLSVVSVISIARSAKLYRGD